MDLSFEMSSKEIFEGFIRLGTKSTKYELRVNEWNLSDDTAEFKQKLLKGSIDIDALINDTIDRDLLINLTRNCKN